MAEQPDTAAIRAYYSTQYPDGHTIHVLASALDAARAQRDTHLLGESYEQEGAAYWQAMAEDFQARFEYAEARINAALDWFARTDCTWTYRVEMARRALTEGTGQ